MQQIAAQQRMPIVWAMVDQRAFSRLMLVAAGVSALTLSAKLQIPWWPVPMTMQTYVVLVIGMAFGTRLGVATVLAYLAAGALGFPVFAGTPGKGIGLAYMMGPTGGYLMGFVAATWLCGKLTARGWDRRLVRCLAAMTLGHLVILGTGVAWLGTLVGWQPAIALGFTPFIGATIAKTLLAAVTLPAAWRLVAQAKDARWM